MHYFAHLPVRRKRRACLVVHLLRADGHDAAQSANHALTHYEIIRAAAQTVLRAGREHPVAHGLNQLFAKAGLTFHRLFSCDGAHALADASASSRVSPSSRSRRHKHHHRERLHFLEIPSADLLAVAPEDQQPAWSAQDLKNLFLLLSRYALGQWDCLCHLLAAVCECSHALLDFLQRAKRGSFPLLHRLLGDGPRRSVTLRDLPLFAASHSSTFVLVRLERIESLLLTTILVSCWSEPLHDIPVCKCGRSGRTATTAGCSDQSGRTASPCSALTATNLGCTRTPSSSVSRH
jgi:hypothetical protein